MDQRAQEIFLTEVLKQCDFALMARVDVREALTALKVMTAPDVGEYLRLMNRLWYSMQSFLVATGNVSKLLWPTRKFTTRGQELRKLLGVPQNSPVAPRSFRNHFEHFDERLENWIAGAHGIFVDSNVGSMTSAIAGGSPNSYLRNFDPAANVLTFQGDVLHLGPVAEGISKIREAVTQALSKTNWSLPPAP